MQPQIRYTKSSDGVNIAYYAIGAGQPFVFLPPSPMTHVELEWGIEDLRAGYERMARSSTWVRYDARGFGLSDRDISDFSLAAQVRDLEAVVEALDLPPAVLMCSGPQSIVALAYESQHPERVVALVLWEGVAQGGGTDENFMELARTNFPMFRQLVAAQFQVSPGSTGMQRLLEEAMTQDDCLRFFPAQAAWDVTDQLPRITSPTLVLHRHGNVLTPAEACRRLAAALPNGTFATLEGSQMAFTDAASFRVVAPFLRTHLARPATTHPTTRAAISGVRTILFTDLVGHTEMMQRLGDARGREVLREHERITRDALSAHGGTEVKTDGDSFMASFASVTSAVECAAALQRAFAQHSETKHEPIVVRMGLNVGEPIAEDGDYFGSAVILGARIKDQAAGGEILVPEAVRHMLSGKSFLFADRGEVALKGFDDAVRLYEVRWRD